MRQADLAPSDRELVELVPIETEGFPPAALPPREFPPRKGGREGIPYYSNRFLPFMRRHFGGQIGGQFGGRDRHFGGETGRSVVVENHHRPTRVDPGERAAADAVPSISA